MVYIKITKNINKKIDIGSIRKTLAKEGFAFIATLFFLLLPFCDSSLANDEDYAVYAKEQAQKAEQIASAYAGEVSEATKNVLAKQMQPEIQALKKEMQGVAKFQCSRQQQAFQEENKGQKSNPIQSPLIIFVSFSMPKESIKGWIAQAQKVRAAVYIRGLVNNSFKDTTKAVSELVQDQIGGLLIDPNLFKKYAITQVPAVVVANGNPGDASNSFDIIYGDVSLDYALEKINKSAPNGERKDLLDVIKKLRSADKQTGVKNA